MSIKNPHILEKEIHGTFDWNIDIANSFKNEIFSLAGSYPVSESQNYHIFTHLVQEFNKKLDKFGLYSSMITPTDAGFRPISLEGFSNDFLLLENRSFLLQEDGSKIALK